MKQKLSALFIALLASVGFIYASNTQVDGIYYDFDSTNKTARVTYRGSYGQEYKNEYINSITIPKTVRYNGVTYNVTSIGREAFEYCSVSSVTIPESVTKLEKLTFNGCESLSHLTLPKTLKCIEESVFVDCYQLREIKFEGTVEQWKQITFNSEWDYYSGIETIKCVDGIVRV
jgi:hypothetical protein